MAVGTQRTHTHTRLDPPSSHRGSGRILRPGKRVRGCWILARLLPLFLALRDYSIAVIDKHWHRELSRIISKGFAFRVELANNIGISW